MAYVEGRTQKNPSTTPVLFGVFWTNLLAYMRLDAQEAGGKVQPYSNFCKTNKEVAMATKGLNKFMGIGHLGKEPEMRITPSGKNVCSFSVALNNAWKTSSGEVKTSTEWVNAEAWGKLGEICNQYLHKGSKLYFEGRLKTESWEDNGVKKYYTKVVVSEMIMLDAKGNGNGNGHAYAGDEESDAGDQLPAEDDIPF